MRELVRIPVLAIGGITPGTVSEVMAAGASGVAVISAILGSGEPQASAAALREKRATVKKTNEIIWEEPQTEERRRASHAEKVRYSAMGREMAD